MIDDRYYRLSISVDKLIKGLANVLFVKSRAGTGKSYNIKEVLENIENLKEINAGCEH